MSRKSDKAQSKIAVFTFVAQRINPAATAQKRPMQAKDEKDVEKLAATNDARRKFGVMRAAH
jgi:hypothetical protein